MTSKILSLYLVFFVWALGLQAAPAAHHHRIMHSRHFHHAKPKVSVPAPHVVIETNDTAEADNHNDGSIGRRMSTPGLIDDMAL